MSRTFILFNVLKVIEDNELHSQNIYDIVVGYKVLKLLKSKDFNFKQL